MSSYSQNDEQAHILDFYTKRGQKTGRFLDVGAYNGKTFSNTLALAESGWRGVCVEPSPHALRDLIQLHRDRLDIEIVGCAIVPHEPTGLLTFADCMGDAVSTLSKDHAERWSTVVKYRPFLVQPISVRQLLESVGYDFDFVNIDVEGTNIDVARAFPWEQMTQVSCICIEHESRTSELMDIFQGLGFRQITWNAENIIIGR